MDQYEGTGPILVTGGSGLIGAAIVDNLIARGRQCVVLDPVAAVAETHDLVTYRSGDVRNVDGIDELFAQESFDAVIHMGALLSTSVAASPRDGIEVNSIGTLNIFEAARKYGTRRVVWASTSAAFGRRVSYQAITGKSRVTDTDLLDPRDLYAGTKALNEVLATHFRASGLDVVGLRPVLTYGMKPQSGAVGQLFEALRKVARGVAGQVPLPWMRSTQINPIFASDCADLFVETCLHPRTLDLPVYNTGTGEFLTIEQIMNLGLAEVQDGRLEYEADGRDGDGDVLPPFDFVDLDSSALRETLEWTPEFSIGQGVHRCVQAYKAK